METEILKAATDAARNGNFAFSSFLILAAILIWDRRNQMREFRLLRRQHADQMRLLIAQISGKQLGNEEIASLIVSSVQKNIDQGYEEK